MICDLGVIYLSLENPITLSGEAMCTDKMRNLYFSLCMHQETTGTSDHFRLIGSSYSDFRFRLLPVNDFVTGCHRKLPLILRVPSLLFIASISDIFNIKLYIMRLHSTLVIYLVIFTISNFIFCIFFRLF